MNIYRKVNSVLKFNLRLFPIVSSSNLKNAYFLVFNLYKLIFYPI